MDMGNNLIKAKEEWEGEQRRREIGKLGGGGLLNNVNIKIIFFLNGKVVLKIMRKSVWILNFILL